MIRMFLFGAGFLAITIALIVLQPGNSRRDADLPADDVPVTRAEADFDMAETEAPEPVLPEPVVAAPQVSTPVVPQTVVLDDAGIRRMTWDTLANLNAATGRESAPGQPGSLLHTIVKRSLDQSPAPVPQSGDFGRYLVQPGDSLVSIAERIYGDVNMTGPLFAANADLLQRPDDLRAGQNLRLPPE